MESNIKEPLNIGTSDHVSVNKLFDIICKIEGVRGFKFIRGEFAAIKYRPWYVWLYLSYLSEYITIPFPWLAFELMAVKTLTHRL